MLWGRWMLCTSLWRLKRADSFYSGNYIPRMDRVSTGWGGGLRGLRKNWKKGKRKSVVHTNWHLYVVSHLGSRPNGATWTSWRAPVEDLLVCWARVWVHTNYHQAWFATVTVSFWGLCFSCCSATTADGINLHPGVFAEIRNKKFSRVFFPSLLICFLGCRDFNSSFYNSGKSHRCACLCVHRGHFWMHRKL